MPISEAVNTLAQHLRGIFGARLQSVVAYGAADRSGHMRATTLAVVDHLTVDDLRACASRVGKWQDLQLATPLILKADEFARSLDVFPFEFGAILADYAVVLGDDPFKGLEVRAADLRHACEIQARGHLLHLREGYIETQGRGDALSELIVESAPALAALLKSVARLTGAAPDGVLARVAHLTAGTALPFDEARRLFPEYLDAIDRLAGAIDTWSIR